uniref:J domain-containing protein n=1 Tax=Chaetoceros debilis TaxID=122233 RepID=A0A7S3Q475_9STRA
MIRRVSWILGGPQPLKLIPNDIERCRTIVVMRRNYFTNTDLMKKDDPYATLDLHWGATISEIKSAFKQKARKLHPDVNKTDSAEEALKKFQTVQKAYSVLMDVKGAPHRDDLLEVS